MPLATGGFIVFILLVMKIIHSALLIGAFVSSFAASSLATTVSLHVDDYIPISSNPSFFSPDMVSTSKISLFGTSNPYTYTSGDMFCLSPGLGAYSPGSDANFNIISTQSSLHHLSLSSTEQDQAVAYMHWLVDNYYDSYIRNVGAISNSLRQDRAMAFENVLREISVDWAGTSASLGGSTGNNQFWLLTMSDYSVADNLLASVLSSGVSSSYRSTSYSIETLQNLENPASAGGGSPGQGQNMLMVAAIPEPGSALLISMLATAWGQRRQRHAKTTKDYQS